MRWQDNKTAPGRAGDDGRYAIVRAPEPHDFIGNALRRSFPTRSHGVPEDMQSLLDRLA